MKIKKLLFKVAFLAALSTALSQSSFGYSSSQYTAATKALKGVPAPELPAKASAHVAKAAKKDRKDVAIATTEAAIALNRASARLIVAAITRVAPEASTAVTAAATAAAPEQRAFIEVAAVTRTPVATQTATPAARPTKVAPPTEGGVEQLDRPINNTTRRTSDGDNDGTNNEPGDNQPQNNFPNPNTNPPKPPPNPPAPAPNNYQRHN